MIGMVGERESNSCQLHDLMMMMMIYVYNFMANFKHTLPMLNICQMTDDCISKKLTVTKGH